MYRCIKYYRIISLIKTNESSKHFLPKCHFYHCPLSTEYYKKLEILVTHQYAYCWILLLEKSNVYKITAFTQSEYDCKSFFFFLLINIAARVITNIKHASLFSTSLFSHHVAFWVGCFASWISISFYALNYHLMNLWLGFWEHWLPNKIVSLSKSMPHSLYFPMAWLSWFAEQIHQKGQEHIQTNTHNTL